MKILIAESVDAFRESLVAELKHRHTVFSCNNGKDALCLLRDHNPDIALLDFAMPGYDGLSILNALCYTHIRPRVLATTYYTSDYTISQAHSLRVDHILLKPCTTCSAMSHINALVCECEHPNDLEQYRELDCFLLGLGFDKHKAGYDCVREALYCVHYLGITMMTKEVYPHIAKVCGGTPARVEKAIRDAIHDAWTHRRSTFWDVYFFADNSGDIPCPTNTKFIWTFPGFLGKSEIKMNIL